jgi:hypothetical protein
VGATRTRSCDEHHPADRRRHVTPDAGATVDTLSREITIGRPREEVAAQLRSFEQHPQLFRAADDVQLIGEDRYRYEVSVGPVSRAVETEVTHDSDDLITWRAEGDGYREAGEIRLEGGGPVARSSSSRSPTTSTPPCCRRRTRSACSSAASTAPSTTCGPPSRRAATATTEDREHDGAGRPVDGTPGVGGRAGRT